MATIWIDDDIKEKVAPILDELDLSLSEAIEIYLNEIIITKGIPFIIKNEAFSNEMVEAINEAEEIINNPDNYKPYENVDDLMKDLNNKE